jgi:amino acid transporter
MKFGLADRVGDPRTWGITFFGACIAASIALFNLGGLTLEARVIGVALVTAVGFLIAMVALPPWRDSQKNLRRVSVAFPAVGIVILIIAAIASR